jgi:hypothetical protein
MRRLTSFACCAAVLAGAALPALAQGSGSTSNGPSFYTLRKDSLFQSGCFGPCACPVLLNGPVEGRFRLRLVSSDPLFDNYSVDQLRWVVHESSGDILVTGSGTYRIGGEVARQHQLSLELQVGSDPIQHFDSGLVTPGSDFSNIDIRISINGETCHDTVFDLRARRVRGLAVDRSSLTWDQAPTVPGHDVVQGSLNALREHGGDFSLAVEACIGQDVPTDGIPFGADPPPGEGYWFLLRDVESVAAGSYDSGSASQTGSEDASIARAPSACP